MFGCIQPVYARWVNQRGSFRIYLRLYGIFLAFLLFHRIAKEQRKALLASIPHFVGIIWFYGMKAGIDNAAHIGGLLSGFVLGIIYVVGYKFEKPDAQRTVSIIGKAWYILYIPVQLHDPVQNVPPLYRRYAMNGESGIVEAYWYWTGRKARAVIIPL